MKKEAQATIDHLRNLAASLHQSFTDRDLEAMRRGADGVLAITDKLPAVLGEHRANDWWLVETSARQVAEGPVDSPDWDALGAQLSFLETGVGLLSESLG